MSSLWPRFLFIGCLWLYWIPAAALIVSAEELPYTHGVPWLMPVAPSARNRLVFLLTFLFVFSSTAFAVRRHQAAAGWAAVALMALVRQVHKRQWPAERVVALGKYAPTAAALVGYLIAFQATRGSSPAFRERCGWEAACGIIAAAYALAGWAKCRSSGWGWIGSRNIGLLIAERSFEGPRWLQSFRWGVVARPRLCAAFAVLALAVECGGFLFVFPRLRWFFVLGTTALQAGITLCLGYTEAEWTLIMFALTVNSL